MIIPFYPDRIRSPIYFASDYDYHVDNIAYKAGTRVILGKVFREEKMYSSFLRLEYDGVRLNEEANILGHVLGRHIYIWLEFESGRKASGFFKTDRDLFTNKYCLEIWSNLEGGHSEKTRYLIDRGLILNHSGFNSFFKEGLERLNTVRFSFCCRQEETEIWDNNYGNIEYTTNGNTEGFKKKANYCVHLKSTILTRKSTIPPTIEKEAFNIDPSRGYEVNWIFTTEFSGNLVFFHKAVIPPGSCIGTHIHEGSEELCYVLQGEALVLLKSEFAKNLPGKEVILKKGIKAGDNNALEEDTLIKEVLFTKGDSLLIKHGGIHGIKNISKENFVFISFLNQY